MLLWLQSYNRKYINVPIANESARNCQQRATIIIFRWAPASYHSHKCAGGNRLIEFFPGNSMRFGRIEGREKARKTKAGQKHSENISSLCGCETKNTVASLLSQSFQSLAILSRALSRYWSKSYTLEIIWFSLWMFCSHHIRVEVVVLMGTMLNHCSKLTVWWFFEVWYIKHMRIRCNAINVALSVKFSNVNENLCKWCDDRNCHRHWCIWKFLTFMNSFCWFYQEDFCFSFQVHPL